MARRPRPKRRERRQRSNVLLRRLGLALVLALLAVLTLIAMNVFKPREHKEVADVDRRPPGHEAV